MLSTLPAAGDATAGTLVKGDGAHVSARFQPDHFATSECSKLASQQRLSPTGADTYGAMSNDVIV